MADVPLSIGVEPIVMNSLSTKNMTEYLIPKTASSKSRYLLYDSTTSINFTFYGTARYSVPKHQVPRTKYGGAYRRQRILKIWARLATR